ncbi:ARF-binding protein [Friedmanniomyces endolithicus]|uniref:ARF-binding protein n=1 Tax=Friedmanniomyces endolithicus TaxID=329885 RepID=A0AAN6JXC7_9PEZI|nr:ARF-binding protein [Friedmanniomyces endolithicus]KAK0953296.1 ARF-binding protein [Friedmanniomyces endolithicus]KAK0953436.1 ARF-binding protein [Friedmanniomyces endolithicus]KAK1022478.1 ARF-binding protein [Friedmanniomyces endolithicus]
MEAASARAARYTREPVPETPLQRYIAQACSPENFEPNLALSLEIADSINAKKGVAPREAAVAIVGYINHRNPNVSLLALSLLDICVKNCGYPFQLQISTKDFLNELLRRFPERPPIRTTRAQNRILELIEEWRRTICETSKYKEDLGFIRDMHRLLSYKGYVFPEIRREDAAVLNPSDNLRSAEEMEAEERAAQSAKLQELIRRGSPPDLQEANKLMKVMAGYDQRNKTDYRAKAAEEVGGIQQKARLLEEMLQGYKPGDEIKEGDVFEELANALASAHPKIQKMCEEESEDTEAVAKLLEINDSIHRTIERYKLVKKGDVEGANAIPKGTLGVSGAGVKKGPDNELSLIDFGGADDLAGSSEPSASGDLMSGAQPAAPPKAKGNALEDDLLGLSMSDGSMGQEGGISLGGSTNGTTNIMAQFSQPQPPQHASNSIFASTSPLPHPQPQSQQQNPKTTYDLLNSLSASNPRSASKPATPIQSAAQQYRQQQAQRSSADPFATLAATPTRQPSPFQFQQATRSTPPPQPSRQQQQQPQQTPSSSGPVDLLGGISEPHSNGSAPPQASPAAAGGDDEWEFSSSLPDQPTDLTVTNSKIKTVFTVHREPNDEIAISSRISNNTAQTISDLTFQFAVTKGLTLTLQPQSSRSLAPNQSQGITQSIRLQGVERGKGGTVKLRWRAGYSIAGVGAMNEQGEIVGLGVL